MLPELRPLDYWTYFIALHDLPSTFLSGLGQRQGKEKKFTEKIDRYWRRIPIELYKQRMYIRRN
jgi:hypothetical protein